MNCHLDVLNIEVGIMKEKNNQSEIPTGSDRRQQKRRKRTSFL